MGSRRFTGLLTGMMAGLLIWALHFALVYAVTGIACARGLGQATVLGVALVPAVVAVATLAALAATAAVVMRTRRSPWPAAGASEESGRFVRWMTAAFAALGLLAILWVGLPAVQVPVCG